MRYCTKCQVSLTLTNQVIRIRNKSGIDSICNTCLNQRRYINYIKNNPPINVCVSSAYEYLYQKSKLTDHGCIEWAGRLNGSGYGNVDTVQWGKQYKCSHAHQLAFILFNGQYDRKFYICHTCNNPACMNPNHLYAGTPTDNARDMIRAGRAAWQKCDKGRWMK